jgi:hypothetical protein
MKMKKVFSLSILTLLVFAVLVHAQNQADVAGQHSTIKTLVFVGKGIAVSPNNPLDFKMVKAGIGTVRISLLGETTELTVGVLVLDEEKYKVKNIVNDDEGGVTGDVYLNDTQVGSLSVSSVMKGNVEVWAGTLTLDGESLYIYILEAPRKVKPHELKEKISDYCRANMNDPDCRERMSDYCEENPTDARCKEIFRKYCKDNLDDTRCREYLKEYCDENPEIDDCRVFVAKRTAKFCREHPDSEHCVEIEKELVEYCLKNSNTDKCRDFCKKHPNKCLRVVKNLADFCIENTDDVNCIDYCKEHPKACGKLAKNLADLCIKDPDSDDCIDYCKEHPVACKKVTAELARFCIGREDNPRCEEYCEEHPNACKRVAVKLEGYCGKHPDSDECKEFCERFPLRCKIVKPVEVDIEPSEVRNVAVQTVSRLRVRTMRSGETEGVSEEVE